jgi:hypothetical protein
VATYAAAVDAVTEAAAAARATPTTKHDGLSAGSLQPFCTPLCLRHCVQIFSVIFLCIKNSKIARPKHARSLAINKRRIG